MRLRLLVPHIQDRVSVVLQAELFCLAACHLLLVATALPVPAARSLRGDGCWGGQRRLLELLVQEKSAGARWLHVYIRRIFFPDELFGRWVHNPLVLLDLVRDRLLDLLVIGLILILPMHRQLIHRF